LGKEGHVGKEESLEGKEGEENRRVEMTIDERLEALVGRHEALAQSVELIAGMQLKVEKEQLKTGRQLRSLGRLVRAIVLDHEARLTTLEAGEEDEDDDPEKG
jgi:hypothetical protein